MGRFGGGKQFRRLANLKRLCPNQWDFGADGTNDFTGQSVGRNFVTPGSYAVRLTVTDNAGLSSSVTQSVSVVSTGGPLALIYWGGDSVTTTRNFRNANPTSQNQQELDGDGANDDTALGWSFNLTNRLSPTNGYFGQPFYGGIRGQVLNATNSAYGDSGIAHNANFKDTLNQRLQTSGAQGSRWHWCVFWDKRDFYNGGASGTVRFDTNSALRMFGISSLENAGTLRWLVRDGTNFFVSEHPLTNTSGTARYTNFTAATDGNWVAYTPATELNFDQTNAVFAPRKFTDITAAGFIVDQDTFAAVRHWIIFENFEMRATMLPESFGILAASVTNGLATLTWSSAPGRNYSIEFKDDLNAPSWQPLATDIPSAGASTSASVPAGIGPARFFRTRSP